MNIKKILNSDFQKKMTKIIEFNKKNFEQIKTNSDQLILCEFNNNSSNHVAFSYLINELKKQYNYKCLAYQNVESLSLIHKIKFYLQKYLNYQNFSIYKSFNVDDFFLISNNKDIIYKSNLKYQEIINLIKSKNDLLNLRIEDIPVGDLIYDSYLKRFQRPTVDIDEQNFLDLLKLSIQNFYFWKNFFAENKVCCLIISDTVYISSIVTRIAVAKNIKIFQCNWDNIHKIDKFNLYAYAKYKFYKKDFEKFTENQKKIALKKAEINIKKNIMTDDHLESSVFFSNNLGISKSTFHRDFTTKNVLEKNTKKKILIPIHCFLDAPHPYGHDGNIFCDFYEWLEYLYKLSKKTNYDWYIKKHPSFLPKTNEILNHFLKDKPKFKLIEPNVSHAQLINEGINCVLTVHGTIGWEYAYNEIPVINASVNNPHSSYNFNLHAKSLKEYEEMILNFEKYKINYDKKNIYEFYFMSNLYSKSTWIFQNYIEVIKEIKGYDNLGTQRFYDYWIDKYTSEKDINIKKRIKGFLASGEHYMKNFNLLNETSN